MRNKSSLYLVLALAGMFAAPGLVLSYTLIGGNLGISTGGNGYQRDVRIFNNFADAAANNNNNENANFPGTTGAAQSIWKAAWAWNSDNANAGKNFDYDWQGTATGTAFNGNMNAATTSSPCGGGVLAFTETPISDGWRIFYCDQWTWSDGPGNPGFNQMDLQGVAAHELGHALGMGHSQSSNCTGGCNSRPTMCAFICNNGVSERTIHSDDAAGLQAIYGAIPGAKPEITAIGGSTNIGGTLVITGDDFPTGTFRVKFTAGTTQNTGSIPGVVNVTRDSATQVRVTVPSTARDGNVFVWKQTTTRRLSNYFPIEIGPALGPECYGTLYGNPTPGTNGIPTIGLVNGPSTGGNAFLQLEGTGFEPSAGGFLLLSFNQATLPYKSASWLNVAFPLIAGLIFVNADGSGVVTFPINLGNVDSSSYGVHFYNQYFMFDTGGPDGFAGTEGLDIEICDPQL